MKKILIITDGPIGDHYIERVLGTYTSENLYHFIQTRESTFSGYNPNKFKFYQFDPTSFYKLSNLLKMDFWQVVLVMENQDDLMQTIKNIRMFKANLRIIALDLWNAVSPVNDDIEWVNQQELIAVNLIDYLPNIPVLAKNIGLGSGEIMEVIVPFGSSFVYRHIGSIEQKNWKIAAIYRNRQLILPSDNKMIQPNDTLILVGDPSVLRSIYRAIKRELGQFPAPYGSRLYLFIDMAIDSTFNIAGLVRRSLFIHRKLKKTLVIRVVNVGDLEVIKMIKSSTQDSDVDVEIDYFHKDVAELLLNDIKEYHIGLSIVSSRLFSKMSYKKLLHSCNVPVLKLAETSFSEIHDSMVVLTDSSKIENISTTIFDISSQFSFNLGLINYLHEDTESKNETIEYFDHLAKIFVKPITVEDIENNPIRTLSKRTNMLHILPFSRKILQNKWSTFFSTDPEVLYRKLDHFHQLFIPSRL